jgi:hypothetical protein
MFKLGAKYKFMGENGPAWKRGSTYKVLQLVGGNSLRPVLSSEYGEINDPNYGWDYSFSPGEGIEQIIKDSWQLVPNKRKPLPEWW